MKLFVVITLAMFAALKAHAQLKTIEDRVAEYGADVRARLEPQFAAVGVPFPPQQLALIGLKQERVLEVHAAGPDGGFRLICRYPILAASGVLGPKLREGDRQVPEGIYRIRELNPNSLFHLSLWIDYPNEFDLARAAEEQRTNPGGEIMIHGSDQSRGCLAVGDPAAEDLFVLAALIGIEHIKVILMPVDFRRLPHTAVPEGQPAWTAEVYEMIKRELAPYTAQQQ